MQYKFAAIAMIMIVMIGMTGLGAATEDVTVSIGDGEGNVTIPIMIENVTNLGSCNILLDFNESVVSVTAIGDGNMDVMYSTIHPSNGWIRVVAHQGSNAGLDGDVIVANVTFTPVDVCSNATSDLTITVTTINDETPHGWTIPYNIGNGVYTSIYVGGLNGDASGDGNVTIHDAMYIAKYVLGLEDYTIACPAIADVSGDGNVTAHDAMYLAKYIVGDPEYDPLK